MNFALGYLGYRALYRIWTFIYNWYVGSLFVIGNRVSALAATVNSFWAVSVTARHLFEPLYQDKTVLGYILGFIFRFFRLLLGSLLLGFVYAVAVAIYAAWALTPVAIIYWGFFS